ncbi:ArnT family glycosyltransferase [Nocardioides pocheonensis]|uniref:ArnT family glycosyltransferase n=1 Tax=Nocardioides pocheonensis TaxID=661485 RepID=UPI0011CE03E8|nr:glycosyltransferase family 39 protein [Nocardioides pocheonensis]
MTDTSADDSAPSGSSPARPGRWQGLVRTRPELVVAATGGLLMLLTSGRYGYHRDELYFLEAGRHLAWGYPDQPPLVPAAARLMSLLLPDSPMTLRLPSTLIAATVVALSGAMARRLGAAPAGQVLAAVTTGICGFVLGMGHLLSTSTFDLIGWTLLTYLLLRLLQGGGARLWLYAGVVAGITLQANVLVGFLLAGFVAGVLVAGPRTLLRSPWPWIAAVLALLVGLPYLVWQGAHGWPQLDVARGIARGDSGSSASRVAFLPLLLLEVGPWLVPVWLFGLVRLGRDRVLRCFAVAFVLLLVVFVLTGGKPYYLAGLFPLLFAAGAQPFLDRVGRPWVVAAVLVLSTPALVFTLPLLPVSAVDPVIAVNYDAGETIGWPRFTRQVADAYAGLPPGTAIVTSNYGQAGAIDRYGGPLGLPSAYSGHNGYAAWGHPPGKTPALVIGEDPALLADSCTDLRTLGRISSPSDVDNDENGTVLRWCVPARSWRELWPSFTHLG